jgi:MoaA/NifB/PqqE/SkfB family radical SAM enzyme
MRKIIGIPKLVHELVQIKCFNRRIPIFGSADVTNLCSLKCKHCYWWLNRESQKELSSDEWRNVVRQNFIKKGVISITLAGGESLLRPNVIEAIIKEMRWRTVSIVTNGTIAASRF